MIQCCTSDVSSVDTGITPLLQVLPSPTFMFRKIHTDRIHKEMTRRVLGESTVFKTCIEMLLDISILFFIQKYKEHHRIMFREGGKVVSCSVQLWWVWVSFQFPNPNFFFPSSILLEFSPFRISMSCIHYISTARCCVPSEPLVLYLYRNNLKKLLPAGAFPATFFLRVFLLVFEAKVFHAGGFSPQAHF